MRDFFVSGHVISNVGLKRPDNEDNYLINQFMNETSAYISEADFASQKKDMTWQWAGVFDGMGGGARGKEASRIAAEELRNCMTKGSKHATESDILRIVRQGFLSANRRIIEERKKHSILGTTATFLCFHENRAKFFYLGDSRAYLLREGRFYQLTKDQTLAALKIEAGIYDASHPDVKKDSQRLTEFVGADETMESLTPLESGWITLKAADKILMCSDGLNHLCSDTEIKEILESGNVPEELTDKLVRKALENGGTDNVTCLVIRVGTKAVQPGGYADGN